MRKKINLEGVGILDLLYVLTLKYGDNPALQVKEENGIRSISYNDLRERSVDVSAFLIKQGIPAGANVAILTENRPEWAIAFFGIVSAACVTVPVDAKLSLKEIMFILNDSGAQCLLVSKKWREEILARKNELPQIKYIISLDPCDAKEVTCLYDLKREENDTPNRPQEVKPENTALIVYTSGTTGVAKGVELSYRGLLFEAMALYELVGFTPQDSFISILPLNHMLEITGDLIAPLYAGAKVTYCDSLKPNQIISLMKEVKATGMICVPLVLKMFYNGVLKEVEKLSPFRRKLFYKMFDLSKALLGKNIRAGKLLFAPIHKKFGKHFKYFVSGGAPLDVELERNADVVGFMILQGYGLTETSPVAAVNTPKARRYGSIGKPLKGVEVKIVKNNETDREGEIIIRGPNVMKGYYRQPEKTAEVLKDGWFYSGDLGYYDKDGFLFISGRAKNLIVLGGGKKIFPEEVEQVMAESPYIKEICVLGRKSTQGLGAGTEEVYAVVVPNLDRFPREDAANKEKIKAAIAAEIKRLSENLAEYKKISGFSLYFDELPKTSTRKVKRKEVLNLIEIPK